MESVVRVFHPPKKSYFLFGPRGTGKSTWVKHLHADATVIDLLEPEVYRSYKSHPGRLRETVEAKTGPHAFLIDEIQKVPSLLSLVHALIEEDKSRQFILTGSSARKLKRDGVDLLGGRALLTHMHPFIACELDENFSLDKALHFGMLPLIYQSETANEDLKAYLALYMKEEVQMEGLVRNVDEFAQFLEIISFSQGSVLNYSNIARECGVSGKSVENYVSILEDLLLAFKVPVFSKRAKRILVVKPKFYYFDAGVYRAIRPKGPLDFQEELGGIALETLVAQHLRAWIDYSEAEGKLFYWRTKAGLEVDFVMYGELGFCAIEVKHTTNVNQQDLKGLNEFKKDYPEAQCMLLYRGKEVLRKGDVMCYPMDLFFKALIPNQAIEIR